MDYIAHGEIVRCLSEAADLLGKASGKCTGTSNYELFKEILAEQVVIWKLMKKAMEAGAASEDNL